MNLKNDAPLSNFAFNCNLRHYSVGLQLSNSGFADGGTGVAKLNTPCGVALDGDGNMFVADSNNRRIRKITPAGIVTTVAGSGHEVG